MEIKLSDFLYTSLGFIIGLVAGFLITNISNGSTEKMYEQALADSTKAYGISYVKMDSTLSREDISSITSILIFSTNMPKMTDQNKIDLMLSVKNNCTKDMRLDPYLMFAMMDVESSFNPSAIGGHGEIGLFQVKRNTAKYILEKFGYNAEEIVSSLADVTVNTFTAGLYLSYLLDQNNDNLEKALSMYNGYGPYPSRYSKEVLSLRKMYMDAGYIYDIEIK